MAIDSVVINTNAYPVVSWNYKHLANVNKEREIHIVILQNNDPDNSRIITPLELVYDES